MVKQKKSKRSILFGVILLLLLIAGVSAFYVYKALYTPQFMLKETAFIYVDESTDFDDICRQIGEVASPSAVRQFKLITEYLKYPENIKTGKYAINPSMSQMELINNLRRGLQASARITFNNIRLKEDMAERLAEQLMIEKQDILYFLNNPSFCDSMGFSPQTIIAMFIPNTYEVYWNISAERLMLRMKREYDAFWTDARKEKAQDVGLTPLGASILASIVEEETAAADEYPVVAGLYINRLNRGIPLQADPTVKFAVGNFSLQRVLFEHLEIESPYNTYKYAGLPPGPLRAPSIRGIEAVLDYTKHNYIYMCAKEDFSGRHNFAVTLAEHNRNADRYRAELNRRNIR